MKPDNQLNNNHHPPRSFAQLIELANAPMDPNLPIKAYIQICLLLYQRCFGFSSCFELSIKTYSAMTSISENNLELAFIYLLRAASTHAISKGTLGSIILGAVVLIVSPTLNRVLVEDLPSKHPDYPLLTSNFQANPQVVCDPVSTLDSAADEEEEDVGAPQSEVNEQAGITQYINPCLPTFSAILKHRFINFLVYEVDNQGQVVHLKDINDPCASEESQDKIVKSKPVSLVECPVDSEVKLLEILCTSELEILKQFVSQGPPSNAERRESKKPTTETKKPSLMKSYINNQMMAILIMNQQCLASYLKSTQKISSDYKGTLSRQACHRLMEGEGLGDLSLELSQSWYILGSTYPIQNSNHQFLVNYLMNRICRLSLFNQASHPTDQEGGGTNHERDRLKIENLEKRLEDLEIVKDLRSRAEIWKEIRWLKDLETQNQTNQIRRLINQPGIEDNCVGMSDIREFTKSIAVRDLKQAREQESAAQRLEQDAQQKTSEMQVSIRTEEATDYVLAGFKKCCYSQLRQLSHYTMAFDGQKFPLKVEAG
ncbi:hypothetical protein PPACK8108_LOCUS20602 [Phakopsora pachyrhizi]|uniref:Uncharacterized protein n=1 Tax=Phakopsora pachyrhizi TaxID=170000 RepID=A0AAV0BI70_PHAPC|nr:hypothetical protein PPACK8108_LOCUS20602 [Phakopsora pachyrhizi]